MATSTQNNILPESVTGIPVEGRTFTGQVIPTAPQITPSPTTLAIRTARSTAQPTDMGIGTATTIQKNPDGTTTTTTAPGYGSQSVGGARMGVSSVGATTTTPSATPAGTPIATTAGTGGQATGYGYETYYNDTKLKGEIPVDFEEWKKKNTPKEDNRIDTSTGLPVSEGKPTEPKPTEATQKTTTEKQTPAVPVQVVANTMDEAFSTLMAGGQLADTRQNFGFKAVYGQFNAINTLDAKTLGQKMSSGEITPQIENLLARYNPEKYAQAKKISEDTTVVNDINTNAEILYSKATGTTTPAPVKTSDQMMQDIVAGIEKVDKKYSDIVAEAYAANPQIKEKGDKIAVIDDKIDTIDTEIDKMYETYRTKYPDVPQAMLMGMVNRATYGLTQERNALVKENKLLYAQYKDEKDMIDKGIEYDIQQDEKMNERKFELQKILYGDKREEEIDLRELAQAEEVLNESRQYDEKTKEEARLQLYQDAITKLGLTPIKGATLEGLMEQFAGGMKEATDYERKLAADTLAAKDKLSSSDFITKDIFDEYGTKIGEKIININTGEELSPSEYNDATGGTQTNLNYVPDSFSGRTKATQNIQVIKGENEIMIDLPEGTKAGQCAFFANDYGAKLPGYKRAGDEWSTKQVNINSFKPVAGGLFMYTPGAVEKGYGHIGIVEKVNPDGSIQVYDSNFKGDEKTTRRTIAVGSNEYKLLTSGDKTKGGFFNPQGAQKQEKNEGLAGAALAAIDMASFPSELARKNAKKDIQKIAETGVDAVQKKLTNIYLSDLGQEEKKSFKTNVNTINAMERVSEKLDKIPTSWTDGGFEKLAQKIGQSDDPELAGLQVAMNNALDILRRGRSGAALTEYEEGFYNTMFPSISKNFKLNKATISGLVESLQDNVNSNLNEFYGDTIYNKIWGQGQSDDMNSEIESLRGGTTTTPTTNFSSITDNFE